MGTSQVQGGRIAAAHNKRRADGKFREGARAADPDLAGLGTAVQSYSSEPVVKYPVPAHLTQIRPFPQISGKQSQLNQAIDHLEAVARAEGIQVHAFRQDPSKRGNDLGSYDPNTRSVYLRQDICENDALYAFSLAHELGHALDPKYEKMAEDYSKGFHRGAFEVVAEATAIRSIESFGLKLDGAEAYLNDTKMYGFASGAWKRSLQFNLYDRYQCSSLLLLKPTRNQQRLRKREEVYLKSAKRAGKNIMAKQRDRARRERKQKASQRSSRRRGGFGRRRRR